MLRTRMRITNPQTWKMLWAVTILLAWKDHFMPHIAWRQNSNTPLSILNGVTIGGKPSKNGSFLSTTSQKLEHNSSQDTHAPLCCTLFSSLPNHWSVIRKKKSTAELLLFSIRHSNECIPKHQDTARIGNPLTGLTCLSAGALLQVAGKTCC